MDKTQNIDFKEFIIPCENSQNCLGNLLFIHGYCVDHTYFVASKELSKYFNVYMIDLTGHGTNTGYKAKDLTLKKMSEYVVDYVNYKNLNNFVLMGHSMGGGLASWVANLIPQKIKKLILVSPYNMATLFIIKHCGLIKGLKIFYPKTMDQKYELLDILYKDYKKYINDSNWIKMNENQLEWQLANWKNMKKLGHKLSSFCWLFKTRKMQKNINLNTLLLVGKYDRAIDGQHTVNGFKKYFKNKLLDIYMFKNSGHLCFEEEQELFVNKVIEFVKK